MYSAAYGRQQQRQQPAIPYVVPGVPPERQFAPPMTTLAQPARQSPPEDFFVDGTWPQLDARAREYNQRTGNRAGVLPPDVRGGSSGNMRVPVREAVVVHRVMVDARDRFDPTNSSPFNFTLDLVDKGIGPFKSVQSVEVKGLAFPKIANEPYVVMCVEQFNSDSMLETTFDGGNRMYAVFYFDTDQMPVGAVKPIKAIDFYQKTMRFNPPIALNQLTVSFRKWDGTTVTTADTGGAAHVSFVMEVAVAQQ